MMPWIRSTWTNAGQIAAVIDPDDAQEDAAGATLHTWHARLVGEGELGTALEFMAHAMSRYDCVAWAARAAIATGIIDRTDSLFVKVLQWIDNPQDDLRRAAGAAAEAVSQDSPAKLLCMAVWFSGGSLTPEELSPVQPPADICARMAAASLLAGAYALVDPDTVLGEILEIGEEMITSP